MINHKLQEINRAEIGVNSEVGIIDLQNKVHIVRMEKISCEVVSFEDDAKFEYNLPSSCKFTVITQSTKPVFKGGPNTKSYSREQNPVPTYTQSEMTLSELTAQCPVGQRLVIKDKYGKPYGIKFISSCTKEINWPQSQISFFEGQLAIIR